MSWGAEFGLDQFQKYLGIRSNNIDFTSSDFKFVTGQWYSAELRYEDGLAQMFLDGKMVHHAVTGPLTDDNSFKVFHTTNFQNANRLHGCIRNLTFHNDTSLHDVDAFYPLIEDLEDDTGNYSDVILGSKVGFPAPIAPSIGNPLCHNGIFINNDGGQDITTAWLNGITVDDIDAVTCSTRDALSWDLADKIGNRDLPGSLKVVRQLIFQKESHIGLAIGIYNRVKDLMFYRDALDKGWVWVNGKKAGWNDLPPEVDDLLSDSFSRDPRKTHPFRLGILIGQAGKFSMRELMKCQRAAADTRMQMVSSTVPPLISLELLLIKMLS
jgi:hypothetical protein